MLFRRKPKKTWQDADVVSAMNAYFRKFPESSWIIAGSKLTPTEAYRLMTASVEFGVDILEPTYPIKPESNSSN